MAYRSNKTEYSTSKGYQVLGYAAPIYDLSPKTAWRKSICCGSFKFGSQCSDCPQ